MPKSRRIPPDIHRRQIEAYEVGRPVFEKYAEVLERVLANACAVSFPEALVQSRAKTLSSFAEKCARRYGDHPDAINEFTDLCGARVIVQTLEQVRAVCRFIEANFRIHERDDKTLRLSEGKFGYRDMHYVVGLRPDRCRVLGITDDEKDYIGSHRAELQVRTWLQHAWADTVHDRIYKNPLNLSREIRRTGALQAALIEEGDRNFGEMADTLDGMIANYGAFATKEEVLREIEVQELLLASERQEEKKPGLALRLAHMKLSLGRYPEVVSLLEPHELAEGPNQPELLSDLGFAQCRANVRNPEADAYGQGVERLERSLLLLGRPSGRFVQDLRKSTSLLARTHRRLGWAKRVIAGERRAAREHFRLAHEAEPTSPYYLADMLCHELDFLRKWDWLIPMRGAIGEALQTCRAHATAGIELPRAHFAAARLSLVLGRSREDSDESDRTSDDSYAALGFYARGLQHSLDERHCVLPEILEQEVGWIAGLGDWERLRPPARWALDLLRLGERRPASRAESDVTPRGTLIVVGGAGSMDTADMDAVRPLLELVLEGFEGTVISGGTSAGVPGCVGDLAAELQARGAKRFRLVGYLPRGRTLHEGYDPPPVQCEETEFSPEQPLRIWKDLFDEGTDPRDVLLIGFGGGRLSAAEYRVALALGATVAAIVGTGGASDDLAADPLWSGLPNFLPVPFDPESVRALVAPARDLFSDKVLESMAIAFHESHVAGSSEKLPPPMLPWQKLDETYRRANREQALHSISILEAAGLGARPAASPTSFRPFTDAEVDRMAEMEHGRWNVERLRGGWRPGTTRDDASRTHDCIVPWTALSEEMREADRMAVRRYPEILAKAGVEIFEPDP